MVHPSSFPVLWELSVGSVARAEPGLPGKAVEDSVRTLIWELPDDTAVVAAGDLSALVVTASSRPVGCELSVCSVESVTPVLPGVCADPSDTNVLWGLPDGAFVSWELVLPGEIVDAFVNTEVE